MEHPNFISFIITYRGDYNKVYEEKVRKAGFSIVGWNADGLIFSCPLKKATTASAVDALLAEQGLYASSRVYGVYSTQAEVDKILEEKK